MHQLSARGKLILLPLVVACTVALLTFSGLPGFDKGTPVASAAPLNACTTYTTSNDASGFWDAAYEVDGKTSCVGNPPQGQGWILPCSGIYVNANMDVWLTQTLVRGGTRLAESGRTGLLTWAPDCYWHEQVSVTGWGQTFTTPLWACLWVYDQTVNLTINYLCTQDY